MSTYLADQAEDLSVKGASATFTYRRMGPQGGVPLVLLNRFRGTIDWWDPEFLDYLAAEHDVIVFDNVGVGHTDGEPRDSLDGFAEGAIEFIEALGLAQADLLGWSLGGIVAQRVAVRRPELVRKLIVAGSGPAGWVPDAPPFSEKVLGIMAKPDADLEDMLYLFYPETDTARASGHEHFAHVSTRLAAGGPAVSETAAQGMLTAAAQLLAAPFDEVRAELEAIQHPVLYANGTQDVMIPAHASYVAVQHLADATLVLYTGAGHAFLFQRAKEFTTQVTSFLAA
ncbi:alpha/beta fold hydrolase [Streptomyces sp. TLI_185]|uniref:alpha/beta fold hydrolase n=1 Tax=Streptomyces sp. TLI_185 TaxID=2485151 RepID=UPI000F4D4B56|nr:alpha/beta hydrolase [Streptomyces sp. TLI_185]RPF31777.1 pimeloyl-ACP methyl ester carboxylesterase [Streptomyces sp. TLI_185]